MPFDVVIKEMHCPKCKEVFEEGSRRFCPTDGGRLVSDEPDSNVGRPGGGVFANLIPKIGGLHELDETLPERSRPAEATPDPKSEADANGSDDVFFEIDDLQPDFTAESEFLRPAKPAADDPKPLTRKVNPYDIPAGHVDLGDTERAQLFSAEFKSDDPESFVGRIVKGRYKVTAYLGEDETGLAFLGDDKILDDKKVLVRILHDAETDEIMDSILAEERVSLSHFSHPNVARLIDSGQFADGTNFLISEYVDALSVRDIQSIHGPYNELRTARVVRQVAGALNEAHQQGIIHRDIRPDNLIIDPSAGDIEQTTLVNFGASNGDANEHNFEYKSPEVLDGRIATIASDIYSLAVVSYEMLTGQMPFTGASPKEIVRAQYAGPKLLPSNIRPELPQAVDDVLAKALSFRAADRFPKARDFGDAFYTALVEAPQRVFPKGESGSGAVVSRLETITIAAIEPEQEGPVPAASRETPGAVIQRGPFPIEPGQPAWKSRSPEPPEVGTSRTKLIVGIGFVLLLAALGGWYYIVNHPAGSEGPAQTPSNSAPANEASQPPLTSEGVPPLPRNLPQPPNTSFYQNGKQNLRGDLLRNFVGFTMYYPKDWKVNGPQEGATPNARGKFIDISRSTPDARLQEQMLISYYSSKGTMAEDRDKFPQLVNETNETLKKLLPGYQQVSAGEVEVNGWKAYEVKFQAGGTSGTGERLVVWGRRLYIPAARLGVRNGFEITMLATSLSSEVRGVDDVGVKGELAAVLFSFEPSQNF